MATKKTGLKLIIISILLSVFPILVFVPPVNFIFFNSILQFLGLFSIYLSRDQAFSLGAVFGIIGMIMIPIVITLTSIGIYFMCRKSKIKNQNIPIKMQDVPAVPIAQTKNME